MENLDLTQQINMLSQIIDTKTTGIVLATDPAGMIIYASPDGLNALGHTEKTINGVSIFTLFSFTPDQKTILDRSIAKGTLYNTQIPLSQHKDKHPALNLDLNIAPIKNNGTVICLMITANNSKYIKLTADLLERSLTELNLKDQELDRFIYTVSHDLRNPLITIKGFTDIMVQILDKQDPVKMKDSLQRVLRASDKMDALLHGLLELSRINRSKIAKENIPLGQIIAKAIDLLDEQIKSTKTNIQVPSEMLSILCDKQRMIQAFQKVLENAIKFSSTGEDAPAIIIDCSQEQDQILCCITDNGIGIEEKHHEAVFNVFNQLDSSTDGCGMGLPFVKSILGLHNSDCWIKSAGKNKGTVFCFTFPAIAL
jgi:signal transduction histidine kinase